MKTKQLILLATLAAAFATATTLPAQTANDLAGPIKNPGMNVLVDSNGVQAVGYQFENHCAKPSPWQAKWIWLNSSNPAAGMFRKEIILSDAPKKVDAWFTADTKYLLYVNGRLVSRGPADIGRDYAGGSTHRWFYDFRDLTPFFQKGTNVVAAEVFRQWPIRFAVSRGQPGFLFEAEITDDNGQKTILKSDTTWRSQVAAQFPDATTFDAAKEPAGWRLAGFDDSSWPASREVNDVWSPLVPSEIPPLMEARYPVLRIAGLPADKIFTNDGSFKVVFDRVLSAYPTLEVKGGKGAELTVKAHHGVKMILAGGEENFEFPFMDEIAPSFTVELENVTEPVKIEDAGAIFTSQPVEYRGAFECSDEYLNQIWKVSRWAVQICLQTHHLDSPNHQEPISDPGDYIIEDMVNNYAFAQPWLARQDIRKFAWILKNENYHNFHTSYSIAWLQMLMDYYDYTGDKSLVVEMAPYVHGLMDTYASWRGTNGLISEAPNYMFMDWVTIGGFNCHHPPAVIGQGYLTADFYHGLAMASRVAELTGNSARVKKYKKLRREIAEAFNHELWVPEKGLYRDGKPFQTSVKPGQWLPADTNIETFSPHVNLLAVLYDLAPKKQQAAIVEKVLAEKPLNTQPWFMHWVFQAIDHVGLFDKYGTEQMRRWRIVPETQSFHEMWKGGDLSHGWCSTPLVQMSSRILGVTPATPGFKTISIRPQLCDLTWARGKVPTPHGDVEVSWALRDNKFTLDVIVPAGAEAEVTLPVSRFEKPLVTLDGKKVGTEVHVTSGAHHFEVADQERHAPVAEESLSPLKDNKPPQNLKELWAGYDPRKEPLDTEICKEWKQDGVVLRVVRYRIGIFHGKKAMMAAIYGFPEGGTNLPGLLQMHGGGQHADVSYVLANAKRGYACISINWGGNPLGGVGDYQGPNTDWGAIDATQTGHNDHYGSLQPDGKTVDSVESGRNNNWFLITLAGRRALTFLEQQPEVNSSKLGVFGHSMGGNLSLYVAATDKRVKAAAPSCGGGVCDASDNIKDTPFNNAAYAAWVTCPILFLNPANDFHGTIAGVEATAKLVKSKDCYFARAPYVNHNSPPEFIASSLLWFDHYLKGAAPLPRTPAISLELKTSDGVPRLTVKPGRSRTNEAVDVYYTQQDLETEPKTAEHSVNRFWHHVSAREVGGKWIADLPLMRVDQPLWVYANVLYPLPEQITGTGFYCDAYTATNFSIASSLQMATPEMLQAAGVKPALKPSLLIESFQAGWQAEWYSDGGWNVCTHKLNCDEWKAPPNAHLVLDVLSAQPNKLVVRLGNYQPGVWLDDFGAQVELKGGSEWQTVSLAASDFHEAADAALSGWKPFSQLELADLVTLEAMKDGNKQTAGLGATWQGPAPQFRNLRWENTNATLIADPACETKK